MTDSFDLFVSYHHAEGALAERIVRALGDRGLSVFHDVREIEDFESISARLRVGLARSKAMVAVFSATYPTRRACQFELTAAFLAAQRLGPPERRVLVLNPESQGTKHIEPVQLRDALFRRVSDSDDDDTLRALAADLEAHVSQLDGELGDVAQLGLPRWLGLRPSAATRFVGRQAAMWQIHSTLHAGELSPMTGVAGPGVAQLRGLGGIGKTLLAQEYALRFGSAYPGGVFWLSAGGDTTPAVDEESIEAVRVSQVRALAEGFGVPLADSSSPGEVESALARALAEQSMHFLWVVDDIPSQLQSDALRRWFAPHPLGRTLLTTRSGSYGALARAIEPSTLPADEALELLKLHRGPSGERDELEARSLAEDLGHHALAVDVAGAAVAVMPGDMPFAAFRAQLADVGEDVMEFAAELADTLPTGHSPSIAATLLSSIDALGAEGLALLHLAAELAVAPIPATLVASIFALTGEVDSASAARTVARARKQARDASLIEPTEDGGGDSVHALVSRTIRHRVASSDRERPTRLREAAVAVLVDALEQEIVGRDGRAALQPLLPHARHLAQTVQDEPQGLRLLMALADYDSADGSYAAAFELRERALAGFRRALGEDHRVTLIAQGAAAFSLWAMGRLAEARALEEDVVDRCLRTLGDEDRETLTAKSNLASTLRAQGELSGARTLQEQVLEVRQRLLGYEHHDTLTVMSNLAETLRDAGDLRGARALQEPVLAGRRRAFGDEHPATLMAMSNLSGTLGSQGELSAARDLQEYVFHTRRRVLGEEHPDTLTAMNNLAATLLEQHELGQALGLAKQALHGRLRMLGEDHPDTLASMNNLAITLQATGATREALALMDQTVDAHTRALGLEHPSTRAVAEILAQWSAPAEPSTGD